MGCATSCSVGSGIFHGLVFSSGMLNLKAISGFENNFWIEYSKRLIKHEILTK